MRDLLRRLQGRRRRARRPTAIRTGEPQQAGLAGEPDAQRRIDAARKRLKATIPAPQEEPGAGSPSDAPGGEASP